MANTITRNKTTTFGEYLRSLREDSGFTLKKVSEEIGIDTSLLAKIERNERHPSKQVLKSVSIFFKIDEKVLQSNLISDLIAYKILEEEVDLGILKMAEEKVKYFKKILHGE